MKKHIVPVLILLVSGYTFAQTVTPVVPSGPSLLTTIKEIVLAILSVNIVMTYVSAAIEKIPVLGPMLKKYLFDVIMANPAHP